MAALQGHPVADRPQPVAQMQGSGGLHPGEHPGPGRLLGTARSRRAVDGRRGGGGDWVRLLCSAAVSSGLVSEASIVWNCAGSGSGSTAGGGGTGLLGRAKGSTFGGRWLRASRSPDPDGPRPPPRGEPESGGPPAWELMLLDQLGELPLLQLLGHGPQSEAEHRHGGAEAEGFLQGPGRLHFVVTQPDTEAPGFPGASLPRAGPAPFLTASGYRRCWCRRPSPQQAFRAQVCRIDRSSGHVVRPEPEQPVVLVSGCAIGPGQNQQGQGAGTLLTGSGGGSRPSGGGSVSRVQPWLPRSWASQKRNRASRHAWEPKSSQQSCWATQLGWPALSSSR